MLNAHCSQSLMWDLWLSWRIGNPQTLTCWRNGKEKKNRFRDVDSCHAGETDQSVGVHDTEIDKTWLLHPPTSTPPPLIAVPPIDMEGEGSTTVLQLAPFQYRELPLSNLESSTFSSRCDQHGWARHWHNMEIAAERKPSSDWSK